VSADIKATLNTARVDEPDDRREPPAGERLLAPGDRLPDFVLPDPKGTLRFFYQNVTGAPTVFFMAANTAMQNQWDEIKELAAQAAAIRAAGADLVIVSNDGIESLEMVSKIIPEHAIWLADIKGVVNLGLRSAAQFLLSGITVFVLDGNQRIVAARGHTPGQATWALEVLQAMNRDEPQKLGQVAPILMLPAVLEPADCSRLIEQISASATPHGAAPIADKALAEQVVKLLLRRIGPEVEKVFSFDDFTIEDVTLRWDDHSAAAEKVRAVNDPAVEGRPFLLLVDLDAAAYTGGETSFPEFGPHRYQPGAGGAIVHAGALLRELAPVASGRRSLLSATLRRTRKV